MIKGSIGVKCRFVVVRLSLFSINVKIHVNADYPTLISSFFTTPCTQIRFVSSFYQFTTDSAHQCYANGMLWLFVLCMWLGMDFQAIQISKLTKFTFYSLGNIVILISLLVFQPSPLCRLLRWLAHAPPKNRNSFTFMDRCTMRQFDVKSQAALPFMDSRPFDRWSIHKIRARVSHQWTTFDMCPLGRLPHKFAPFFVVISSGERFHWDAESTLKKSWNFTLCLKPLFQKLWYFVFKSK